MPEKDRSILKYNHGEKRKFHLLFILTQNLYLRK